MAFKGAGLIDAMRTDGRTTVQLNAPDGTENAANKRVTADTVKVSFHSNGKDISHTEAVGNAELYIEPLVAAKENYKTTINAPRFDCEFFPTGNDAKLCRGGRKTKTVRVPTVPDQSRGKQTLLADQLSTEFDPKTKDVEKLIAAGNAKFTEMDRNAIANEITFLKADETVRLRGGSPTTWDSKNRAKATEIDWDTRDNLAHLRGSVSTTYYSLAEMGSAAPFSHSEKPVFLTSDIADFDLSTEIAVYNGNARGWQDNNYVRGDRFTISSREGKFTAENNVQSAAYNAKVSQRSGEQSVPVFASAGSMIYFRDTRLLQYRKDVDIRQGTDRITSQSADVYLNEANELDKTVAETGVVITQPGRRATGDWVQYTSNDEVAILRGAPARVVDGVNGTSQASQMTMNMRDNKVVSESKGKDSTSGRIRSTYKVQPKQ